MTRSITPERADLTLTPEIEIPDPKLRVAFDFYGDEEWIYLTLDTAIGNIGVYLRPHAARSLRAEIDAELQNLAAEKQEIAARGDE